VEVAGQRARRARARVADTVAAAHPPIVVSAGGARVAHALGRDPPARVVVEITKLASTPAMRFQRWRAAHRRLAAARICRGENRCGSKPRAPPLSLPPALPLSLLPPVALSEPPAPSSRSWARRPSRTRQAQADACQREQRMTHRNQAITPKPTPQQPLLQAEPRPSGERLSLGSPLQQPPCASHVSP
jgi:hypothetical protein